MTVTRTWCDREAKTPGIFTEVWGHKSSNWCIKCCIKRCITVELEASWPQVCNAPKGPCVVKAQGFSAPERYISTFYGFTIWFWRDGFAEHNGLLLFGAIWWIFDTYLVFNGCSLSFSERLMDNFHSSSDLVAYRGISWKLWWIRMFYTRLDVLHILVNEVFLELVW